MVENDTVTQLSPAAQAVLDAFLNTPGEEPMPGWNYNRDLAAALRAVAEQIVLPKYQYADWEMAHVIMQEIQDIADELEGQ